MERTPAITSKKLFSPQGKKVQGEDESELHDPYR
jgi:hypothetical protein